MSESEWQPTKTAPKDGSRVLLLVESECVWDEPVPAALVGGWRRVSHREKIVGWKPPAIDAALEE